MELVLQLSVEQRDRWLRGDQVPVETYLAQYPELERDNDSVLDLICSERQLREELGEQWQFDEYVRRFPKYAERLETLFIVPKHADESPSALTTPSQSSQVATDGAPAPAVTDALEFPRIPGYQVLGELGRGGMGVVYRAFDEHRKQIVALKTVQSLNPRSLYLFKQEFRTLADVAHPNLVTLHELVSDGRLWFFTMELVEGADFLTHVRTDGAESSAALLTAEQLVRLRTALKQLVEGVIVLHQAGKLHRDIKPSNVLVAHSGRVVLMDFGLAAQLDQAGAHHSTKEHILGTAAYMSPEQAAARPLTPASDWYSVGAMLFQTLTGRLPFGGSALDIVRQKQESDVTWPNTYEPEDLVKLAMDLLRREPAARPTGQEVLRRLATHDACSAVPLAAAVPQRERLAFVGRRAHLHALWEAYDELRERRATTIFVQGRSGTGKSALVQRFLNELAARNEAVILSGRCYERELVPYKAVDGLIDALSHFLARLPALEVKAYLPRSVAPLARVFPVLRRVPAIAAAQQESAVPDPQELRKRAFTGLRELLARLGDAKPLVLSIDDLQWGDADSAALLTEIVQPPDAPLLLLIGCHRSEDATTSPFLQALSARPDQHSAWRNRRELAVEPLSTGEAFQLAMTQLDSANPRAAALAENVARESGGSPLFVYELLQAIPSATPAGESTVPERLMLDEVLWNRVQRLPGSQRELLEVISIAGQPLLVEVAGQAAGNKTADLALLDSLRVGHFIRSTGAAAVETIEPYHDRVRESVVAHLSAETLARHHRRLAAALEASGSADPEALAVHWQSASDLEKAGQYYAVAAAQASETLAFERAARLYQAALKLYGVTNPERQKLQILLADALANAGHGVEAAAAYRFAAEKASTADALEFQRRAALQLLISGHMDQGFAAIGAVLKAVGVTLPKTPSGALASLLLRRAQLWLRGTKFRELTEAQLDRRMLGRLDIYWSVATGLSVVDAIRGADYQTRHLILALQTGEKTRIAQALAFEAAHHTGVTGKLSARNARDLQVAKEIAQRSALPALTATVSLASGVCQFFQSKWQEALDLIDEAEQVFREQCAGAVWERNTAHSFATFALYYLGEIGELGRRLPRLCQDAEARGDLYSITNHKTFGRYLVLLAHDHPVTARKELRELIHSWSRQGFHVQHMNAFGGLIQTALYEGDAEGAWQTQLSYWPALKRSLLLRLKVPRILAIFTYARCLVARGGKSSRSEIKQARKLIRSLRREKILWADGLADIIQAGLWASSAPGADSVDLLRQSHQKLHRAGMNLYAAAAQFTLGKVLDGERGRLLTQQAETWMNEQSIHCPRRMAAMIVPGFPE